MKETSRKRPHTTQTHLYEMARDVNLWEDKVLGDCLELGEKCRPGLGEQP